MVAVVVVLAAVVVVAGLVGATVALNTVGDVVAAVGAGAGTIGLAGRLEVGPSQMKMSPNRTAVSAAMMPIAMVRLLGRRITRDRIPQSPRA
jgi:hypothetical protein